VVHDRAFEFLAGAGLRARPKENSAADETDEADSKTPIHHPFNPFNQL